LFFLMRGEEKEEQVVSGSVERRKVDRKGEEGE
jgi:hypothetical protein